MKRHKISALLLHRNLSVRELSRKMKCTASYIAHLEDNPDFMPSLFFLVRLGSVCQVGMDYFQVDAND